MLKNIIYYLPKFLLNPVIVFVGAVITIIAVKFVSAVRLKKPLNKLD